MIDRLELLSCPLCHSSLTPDERAVRCACGAEYEVRGGIPLLISTVSMLSERQADWFDHEADAEWEIERPQGSPALYRWLLDEKCRRAVDGVEIRGKTVLCVCAGSGMDAEFLARSGARVIALDISLGAIQRAVERSRRHQFDLVPVVADVIHLPFRDASVDVVYVHDGLHHLDKPLTGLAEMSRVARRAVCVAEPARARVTDLAVRLGLALECEDAGNRVARLTTRELEAALCCEGFAIARSERYAMFYRHTPGRLVRLLSYPGLASVAMFAFRLLNSAIGRYGNKLTVVAVRR